MLVVVFLVIMGRECELTGKGTQVGNRVSHSNRKTKRKFFQNLQKLSLFSEKLNKKLRLKIAISTLRIIEKKGGIDDFILGMRKDKMKPKALYLRKQILKKCQN